jgi:hypothetical protein
MTPFSPVLDRTFIKSVSILESRAANLSAPSSLFFASSIRYSQGMKKTYLSLVWTELVPGNSWLDRLALIPPRPSSSLVSFSLKRERTLWAFALALGSWSIQDRSDMPNPRMGP